MCPHASVSEQSPLSVVYYFSGSGHCKELARFFSAEMAAEMYEITSLDRLPDAELAVVVFPVYAQAVPRPAADFLKKLRARRMVLVAAYGRMGFGNVLQEAAALVSGSVVAGGCIPTGHSYRNDFFTPDWDRLAPLLQNLGRQQPIPIPKRKKDILAYLFPLWRARLGVTIHKSAACSGCGICTALCPMKSMVNGRPGADCIRCLRCIVRCPKQALSFSCHPLLRRYLRHPRTEEYFLIP